MLELEEPTEMERRMKKCISMFAVTSLVSGVAFADMYYDPTGDIATGNANLDITQVEITDNGVDLFITVSLAALDGDWGKYMMFIDAWEGGSGDNDNPWARNVSGLGGSDIFLGSWLDGGGGVVDQYHNSGGWWDAPEGNAGLSIDWANNSFTWTMSGIVTSMAEWEISGIDFEIATTGGGQGDPAIDLLGGEGTQPGWGQGSQSTDWSYYEFSTVPAPGVLALFAVAGITRRRRH
tara:strand:+ start:964 stop:1671 length:708 start_codon:yes stop_codon:yes gene_type:complete